jgi:L-alanine-DL-glutamate epimerase-like enolase superfamily enzyme
MRDETLPPGEALQRGTGRIAAARVVRAALPVEVPFAISRETLLTADLAFVELTDVRGEVGIGECAPFPSLTHDTGDSAVRLAEDLAGSLVGLDPPRALGRLRAERQALARRSITGFVGVEMALCDLFARQLGAPLAALWGGAMLEAVETDVTLPIMPKAAVEAFWERFRAHGFRTIKIKVGGKVDEDLARVLEVRRLWGEGVALTLDGNQGYDVAGARRLADECLRHGVRPAFFEQPLPEDDWRGHAELAATLPFPVCLDETVRTAADALRAARERTGQIVNIKLMKSGVDEALRIIRVCEAAGIELMIGGMLESEIAMATSLHVAAGTGAIRYFDLDTPFFLRRRVTVESPWHGASATLALPRGAGHGLRLAPDLSGP